MPVRPPSLLKYQPGNYVHVNVGGIEGNPACIRVNAKPCTSVSLGIQEQLKLSLNKVFIVAIWYRKQMNCLIYPKKECSVDGNFMWQLPFATWEYERVRKFVNEKKRTSGRIFSEISICRKRFYGFRQIIQRK